MELANLFKIFLDFTYFLCISPFRLEHVSSKSSSVISLESSANKYFNKSWLPQKILCLVTTFLGIFWILRDIRSTNPFRYDRRIKSPSPFMYFRVAFNILNGIVKLITVKHLWRNSNDILAVANYAASVEKKYSWNFHAPRKRLIIFLSALNMIFALVTCISGLGLDLSRNHSKCANSTIEGFFELWVIKLVDTAKYSLFLDSYNLHEYPWGVTIITVIGAIGYIQRRILAISADYLILITTLTLWVPARSFAVSLTESHRSSWKVCRDKQLSTLGVLNYIQVQDHFDSIKILSNLINSTFSHKVTFYLLRIVVYYSTSLDDIFGEGDDGINADSSEDFDELKRVMWLCWFLGNTAVNLYFSVDICQQMRSLSDWLSREENRRGIPAKQLMVMINEADKNVVAIQGSNVFPVTHGLVANVMAIVVLFKSGLH